MSKKNGTSLNIYIGGTLVGGSTSASLNMNIAEIDVSSKDSFGRKEILPGQTDWSISGDFIDDVGVSNYEFEDFHTLYKNRTVVQVRFSENVTGAKYYIGSAYLTSVNRDAPLEDAVTGAFTLTGTGLLAVKTYT